MTKVLMKGNEAIAEAAILAGCDCYFGYPITPQNELIAYMAKRLPEIGKIFLQAESELAAINMVFGAATTGARAMTSSSSPGISLKQEGISYMAGCELPGVIVNVARGGPGLGNIAPSQADYFQAVKGGGHGDYHLLVLAPASVQEAVNLTQRAFDLADTYRNPVMILADGLLGQMIEPVELKPIEKVKLPPKTWALTGAKNREPNIIKSLYIDPPALEAHNWKLQKKYQEMQKETAFETWQTEDAQIIIVAFGPLARICKEAITRLRKEGIKAGLIRPITLFPFPTKIISEVNPGAFLVVEMNLGQMVEDVRLAVGGKSPVHFYGKPGGVFITPQDVYLEIKYRVR
ncbi:MAG: 3-methyl-2-oxobutanoate dehydrogenase subunit VorB [bacterium]|nr:3-methyl-2-oxobutanoate dehydrogenase subunit VorB [bacterium]